MRPINQRYRISFYQSHTKKCQKHLQIMIFITSPHFTLGLCIFLVVNQKFCFIFIDIDPLTSIIKQPPDIDGSLLLFFGKPIFEILLDGFPQANLAQFYIYVVAIVVSFITLIGGSTGTSQHCGTARRTWTLFLFII